MDIEELHLVLDEALQPGFRGKLLARGQARSIIWSEGKLPVDAPDFAQSLSHDLLSYGITLLSLSMRLRENGGDENLSRKAFNQAGESIEAVVSNGDKDDPNRGFLRLLSASAFHLGRSSARAFSMLVDNIRNLNISPIENALALIILRSLDQLEEVIVTWRVEETASDEKLEVLIDSIDEHLVENESNTIELDKLDLAIDLALTDTFYSGIGYFLSALRNGESELIRSAKNELENGLTICKELNFVPLWWSFRLAIHLFDDLWNSSFHQVLPKNLPSGNNEKWIESRNLFISSLFCRKRSEIELWPSQLEAAKRSVDITDDLVVSMPTSAGKTRIAELCILRCLAEEKRIIFVTPLRSLSAQTEVNLQRTFGLLGKEISALYGSTGVSKFDSDSLKSRQIVVSTPEKLDFALRNDSTLINDVGLVVLDEGHMIGIDEREVKYEVLIQRLLKREDADLRRIVCLSAVLPEESELNNFVGWLRRDKKGDAICSTWKPTRTRFGEVVWKNDHARLDLDVDGESPFVEKYINQTSPTIGRRKNFFPHDHSELVLATAWKLVEESKSVLIYCTQRNYVESLAKKIVNLTKYGLLDSVLNVEPQEIKTALDIGREWLGYNDILKCLELGVAVHHGALPTPFRKEVERLLRKGIIKVTVSSPTLAQGLNLSATAVVMHSIWHKRNGIKKPKIIDETEFKNVIGRAGRAFVDVEGLVLFPVFDKQKYKLREWAELKESAVKQLMESGLLHLVVGLLIRIKKALKLTELTELQEYILNNSGAWDFPIIDGENLENQVEAKSEWNQNLDLLDFSLLSLLGEQKTEVEDLSSHLDKIFASSLFQKCIAKNPRDFKELINASMLSRTRLIWKNSTSSQRRGYYLAGVSLSTGKELDVIATEANELLVEATGSLVVKDQVNFVKSIVCLAEKLFEISPFKPNPLPKNWQDILSQWLRGESILGTNIEAETDTLQFIENGLVYRLPWGIEAMRVRAQANGDKIGNGEEFMTIDDFDVQSILPVIETGTMNASAALLIQAGFPSRLGAIKAAEDTNASFANSTELNIWLGSDEIENLSLDVNWPTPESRKLWIEFRKNFQVYEREVWTTKSGYIPVSWSHRENIPEVETILNLHVHEDRSAVIMSANYQILGKVNTEFFEKPKGFFKLEMGKDIEFIPFQYIGPDDLSW